MLASAVAETLRRRGHGVVGIDLPECDVTQPADVARIFLTHRPTLLVNCAAYTKVDLCEEQQELAAAVNGRAVGLLAEQAKVYGTRLIHISTDFVFDGACTRPYRTDDQTNPLSAYGRSKLLGEEQLRQVDPPGWIIARTAWLYGRNGLSFPRIMVEKGRAGEPLRVVDDQVGSPTYTYDLAEALLDLVDHQATGLFHVTNSGSANWYEFAKAVLKEFGVMANLTAITTEEFRKARPKQARRPGYSVLDGSSFAAATGRPMRPWPEALAAFRAAVERAGNF